MVQWPPAGPMSFVFALHRPKFRSFRRDVGPRGRRGAAPEELGRQAVQGRALRERP